MTSSALGSQFSVQMVCCSTPTQICTLELTEVRCKQMYLSQQVKPADHSDSTGMKNSLCGGWIG